MPWRQRKIGRMGYFVARGSGPTAFVTQVDDLKNQGDEDNAKDWTFRINDRLIHKSCGLAVVRPGIIICGSSASTNRMAAAEKISSPKRK